MSDGNSVDPSSSCFDFWMLVLWKSEIRDGGREYWV